MSLLRLLTSGRTLVGLQGGVTRYRLKRQGLLPQFGTSANPFRQTACPADQSGPMPPVGEPKGPSLAAPAPKTDQPEEQGSAPITGLVAEPDSKPSTDAAESKCPSPPSPAITPGKPAVASAARVNEAGWARRFWSGLGQALKRRVRPSTNAAASATARSLRQAELSLDSVRVVRNDLSDCDLELVRPRAQATAKSKTRPSRAQPAVTEEVRQTASFADDRALGGAIATGELPVKNQPQDCKAPSASL